MFDAYYAQPKWKQWGLEKRTSAALTAFHRDLIPLSKELGKEYQFEAERMWGTVYWSACLCYRQAHELNPRVSKDSVTVR